MRFYAFLLLTCLILFVFVEAKSSNSSSSKSSSSKSSVHSGKVTKTKTKPIRKHSSDSSDSSEEHPHKQRQPKRPSYHLDRFISEERFSKDNKDSRPQNLSTSHHNLYSQHNATRYFGVSSKNNSDVKNIPLLFKNGTSYSPLQINHNQSSAEHVFRNNTTVPGLEVGWKNFTKPNVSTGSSYHLNISSSQNLPRYKNDSDDFIKKYSTTPFPPGWKNSSVPPSYGWKNDSLNLPGHGWLNHTVVKAPAPDGQITDPTPDFRKYFAVPDHSGRQHLYFINPNFGGSYPKNSNSITDKQVPQHPSDPNFGSSKTISNISPDYGWNIQNPNFFSESDHNKSVFSDGTGYPIHNVYQTSDKGSLKPFKGAKKVVEKSFKSVGKGLSDDSVKDKIKEAASYYFSNPAPPGWVYNPPNQDSKLMYHGKYYSPFFPQNKREELSVDDWRRIIFGRTPVEVSTRPLYSAAFPETQDNFNLNPFSENRRFPDFGQTSNKVFFSPPYYPKFYAGLQNDAVNDHFREKRELSNKTKALISATNKFLISERDCDDTELKARKKRQLVIRRLVKKDENDESRNGEKRILNFPFSGVEAIVQSNYDISVFGGVPEKFSYETTSEGDGFVSKGTLEGRDYENNIINDETTKTLKYFTPNNAEVDGIGDGVTTHSTVKPFYSAMRNRTKLYPVSETIEQFLVRKPVTRLHVSKEPLEKWKAGGSSVTSSTSSFDQRLRSVVDSTYQREVNTNFWKRLVRSDEENNESGITLVPFGLTTGENLLRKSEISGSELSTFPSDDLTKGRSVTKYGSSSYADTWDEVTVQPYVLAVNSMKTNSIQLPSDVNRDSVLSQRTIKPAPLPEPLNKKGITSFGGHFNEHKSSILWNYRDSNSGTTESSSVITDHSSGNTKSGSLESSYDRSAQHFPEENAVKQSSAFSIDSSEGDNLQSSGKNGYSAPLLLQAPTKALIDTDSNGIVSSENTPYGLQAASDSTLLSPAPELKSNNVIQVTSGVDPSYRWKLPNIYTTLIPLYSLGKRSFKINSIVAYSSVGESIIKPSHALKRKKEDNNKSVKDGTVLIRAPLRRIVCAPNERPLDGRCRKVF